MFKYGYLSFLTNQRALHSEFVRCVQFSPCFVLFFLFVSGAQPKKPLMMIKIIN